MSWVKTRRGSTDLNSYEHWPHRVAALPKTLPGEIKSSPSTFVATDSNGTCRLEPSNYSKWSRLVRVTAWILRFWNALVKKKQKNPTAESSLSGQFQTPIRVAANGGVPQHRDDEKNKRIQVVELTVEEMKQAEQVWFAQAQKEVYEDTYEACRKKQAIPSSSPLLRLQPVMDDSQLLRMAGRLNSAHHLPVGIKQPIILPSNHPVTMLRIAHEDAANNHTAGVNHLLSVLNSEFWIVHGPAAVKRHKSRCVACKKLWNKPACQRMAPLPPFRIEEPHRAFSRVGLDYAGPFYTKQGRGKSRTKRYLCLLTCLQSRAVHLEMAWSLDAESFLQAFTRFSKRRGVPELVVSDNGTNFVAAERELREAVSNMNQSKIGSALACKGVKWRFNPPLAPHHGPSYSKRWLSLQSVLLLECSEVLDARMKSS